MQQVIVILRQSLKNSFILKIQKSFRKNDGILYTIFLNGGTCQSRSRSGELASFPQPLSTARATVARRPEHLLTIAGQPTPLESSRTRCCKMLRIKADLLVN